MQSIESTTAISANSRSAQPPHDARMTRIEDAIEKLVRVTKEDATAIRTLARIADAHEQRNAGPEGKGQSQ